MISDLWLCQTESFRVAGTCRKSPPGGRGEHTQGCKGRHSSVLRKSCSPLKKQKIISSIINNEEVKRSYLGICTKTQHASNQPAMASIKVRIEVDQNVYSRTTRPVSETKTTRGAIRRDFFTLRESLLLSPKIATDQQKIANV